MGLDQEDPGKLNGSEMESGRRCNERGGGEEEILGSGGGGGAMMTFGGARTMLDEAHSGSNSFGRRHPSEKND